TLSRLRATSRMREAPASEMLRLDSCATRERLPTPRKERTATKTTRIPIPPSHCVRERQIRTGRGKDSMSVITEEPVVVKPETDSKIEAKAPSPGSQR